MLLSNFVLFACLLLRSTAAGLSPTAFMETHKVVPDVIPTAPPLVLRVIYPRVGEVTGGADLTPTQVKDMPKLFWLAQEGALYTVVMTGPDVPSRTNRLNGEWRHFLVVNVPFGHLIPGMVMGDVVTEYVGARPPRETGYHRYVFLVYKQPGKLTVDESLRKTKNQAKGREKWSVSKFAKEHGLGKPVAGNLFHAQWDVYVPMLNDQFTD